MAQTSQEPLALEIIGAGGNYLFGSDGKKYLDFISGISVSNLGHSNPDIINAIQIQAAAFTHTMVYGELIQAPQVELAARLSGLLPAELCSTYLVNSGSEAVEGAMKLAKRFTGRTRFVALTEAYHGSTQGALSLMSNEYFSQKYRPLLPEIRFIEQNDNQELNVVDAHTAAVFVELVQGEKGAMPCNTDFIQSLRNKCNETGALLVFDEIQTAMGRTGKMFAFEHFGVIPDILVLGKALGGGMPLGAFVSSQRIMQSLSNNPVLGHITTFGGHPVSCAAAIKALYLTYNRLTEFQVEEKEKYIRKRALELNLGTITGKGLLLALDLLTEKNCKTVIAHCIKHGLFTDWFLYAPYKLRIAPPLTVTFDEIEFALTTIHAALKEL